VAQDGFLLVTGLARCRRAHLLANRGLVDHVTELCLFAEDRNPHNHQIAIQLLFELS